MLAEDLINILKDQPKAVLKFTYNVHFGEMCDVSADDFEIFDSMIILPNLCACYPEPD